jgi:hypothetical protein
VLEDRHGDDVPEHLLAEVRAGYQRLAGVKLLSDVIADYIAEVHGVLREQTVEDKLRHYAAFRDWLKADPKMMRVTRRHAGDFVAHLARQDFARKTKEYG